MPIELPALKCSSPSSNTHQTASADSQRLLVATHLLRGWIWETDIDHRFTYLSDSVLTYTGRPPQWHYGRQRQELVSYYIEEDNLRRLQDQLNKREPFGPFVYQGVHEGKPYWVRSLGSPRYDDHGNFIGYRGVAQEVTAEISAQIAKEQALENLNDSECVLRGTIDCFPNAVSVFCKDMRLAFANAHYYSFLDLPASQIPLGTPFQNIIAMLADRGEVYGIDADDAVAKQIAMINKGEVNRYQRTRPNGVRMEITLTPLPCGGFIKTYSDVTERVEAKARLASLARELEMERVTRNALELEVNRLSRMQRYEAV